MLAKNEILALLTKSKPELQARFGVTHLSLFGSYARNEAKATSDIDVLVAFDGPATSCRYFGALFYLEDLFGCTIDLVTEKALRQELCPFIESEMLQIKHIEHSRLTEECAKLDPIEECNLAEEDIVGELTHGRNIA